MRNAVIYLTGPSGVGKYTIGSHIADRTGARLIHNHYWNNVVLSLIDSDRQTPMPEEIWEYAGDVRWAVLKTIAHLAPADQSFVFTHAAAGQGDPLDRTIAKQIAYVAEKRSARFIIVRLTCAAEQLATRAQSPDRARMFKSMNTDAARREAELPPFDPGLTTAELSTLDTTRLSAAESAQRILTEML